MNDINLMRMKRLMMSTANALMICLLLTAFSCSEKDDGLEEDGLPPVGAKTNAPYKVGDYYNVSGVTGIVFEVSNKGKNGTIVSLDEARLAWALDIALEETNARDMDNGMNNMNTIKGISGWRSKYPAFVWCDGKNTNGVTGWYYPAINELKSLYYSWNAIEDALLKYGENFALMPYTSSTESCSPPPRAGCKLFSSLFFSDGSIKDYGKNRAQFITRAIRKF
jgi:hypothetical protein